MKFIDCNFTECTFKQVEFRATRFENCVFDGAKFEWCEMAHVKYEGNAPAAEQFTEVDQERVVEWFKGSE